jgi:hypothetical protein
LVLRIVTTTGTNYCPLCGAEYSVNHVQCTVCGVQLVPEALRGQPLDERQRKEKIVVAWRGGDPLAVSEVIRILRDAGVRHHVQPTNEHMVFELGMPRPKYAVRVFASDVAKARELLADIRESSPFALDKTNEAAEAGERQVSTSPHDWNLKAATIEIWNGDDAPLADLLEACLRENRIGVHRDGDAKRIRLLIMPDDESAAREILREVREATPPA